ncbi:MAG: plasmid pRiA4b ORF-3 family protein [Oscillospiraceae bacterium]|nr:plasmid pRiA4b ORF-3 family protein [Oscillospiraceae bacterium]
MNDKKYVELETNAIHNAVDSFEKFIEFIDVEKPILSVKKAMLGKNDCFKLNSMIKFRRDVTAPNYNQQQYPVIDMMVSIALDGKLLIKSENEKGKLVLTETPNLKQYKSLNEYEKYVYMFQTYWTKYDFERKIGKKVSLICFTRLFREMVYAKKGEKVSQEILYEIDPFYYYLEFFGFGNVILNEEKTNGTAIARFYANELGIKMSSFIAKEVYPYINDYGFRLLLGMCSSENIEHIDDLPAEIEFVKEGNPFDVFKNIFPDKDINKTVDTSKALIDRSGAYLFKVSLDKDIWRTIRLSHEHTLEDLHLAIQDAFDFDNDHLYAFYINGTSKTGKEINGYPDRYGMFGVGEDFGMFEDIDEVEDDEDSGELTANKVKIEDLELHKGARITYIFDFGDNWEFNIVVKQIDKDVPLPTEPEIVESKGESPPQYEFRDEW